MPCEGWWTHCLTRSFQVKVKALTLAEMHAFLQKRRAEDSAAQQEIKILLDELERYNCDVIIPSFYKWLKYETFFIHRSLGNTWICSVSM